MKAFNSGVLAWPGVCPAVLVSTIDDTWADIVALHPVPVVLTCDLRYGIAPAELIFDLRIDHLSTAEMDYLQIIYDTNVFPDFISTFTSQLRPGHDLEGTILTIYDDMSRMEADACAVYLASKAMCTPTIIGTP